jgi:hypothetical protein
MLNALALRRTEDSEDVLGASVAIAEVLTRTLKPRDRSLFLLRYIAGSHQASSPR